MSWAGLARGGALLGLLADLGLRRPGAARGGTPRNVLVVTLDTLRADHLGSYGYKGAQTPVLDALAARGARFAAATTTTPLTLSAHTSLFTGTWPTTHGVRDNTGFYVPDSVQTLAETLKAQGYRTGAFVGAFVLDGRWGLTQGFDTYFDDFDLSEDTHEPGGHPAAGWRGGGPGPAMARVGPARSPSSPGSTCTIRTRRTPRRPNSPRASPTTLVGAYDAEIAYADAQVGRLLAALDAAGRRDDTLVVVMADHGEQLGQHREQSHGFFVYDASVQVPLIIAGPGIAPRVVPDQVRIIDVMPTVLDLVGVTPPAAVQGTSLRPALDGQRQELLAFSETWYPRFHFGWSELQAVRDGAFKFILAPTRELYDLAKDPGELTNLAASDQARADRMERALRALVAQTTRADAAKGPQAVDPAAEQRLRALGYVGSTSATYLEDRPRRDPKDTIELFNLLQLAGTDSEAGRYDEAAAKVLKALAVDPEIDRGPHAARQHLQQGRDGTARRSRPINGRSPWIPRICSRPTTSPWPTAPPARSTRRSSASSAPSSSTRAAAGRTSSSATSTCSAASRPRRSRCCARD